MVSFFLEKHVIDEEASSNQRRFTSYVEIHWKSKNLEFVEYAESILLLRDAEVVHVGEGLLDEPGPLLGDSAHLVLPVRRHHLELHVTGAGEGTPGALDDQGHVTVSISDLKSIILCLRGSH